VPVAKRHAPLMSESDVWRSQLHNNVLRLSLYTEATMTGNIYLYMLENFVFSQLEEE
jgi:hypothetical protein